MSKYVISQFQDGNGIHQEVVRADSKLEAMIAYLGVDTDEEGHTYLDLESLLVDNQLDLGYDIAIMKISKSKKYSDTECSPWPFPTQHP